MTRIKFYSEEDLASYSELSKIIAIINDDAINHNWNLADAIDFHNIIKYLHVKKFSDYIEEHSDISCADYIKQIKSNIGRYLGTRKSKILSEFTNSLSGMTEDFLDLIDKFGTYREINETDFEMFLKDKNVPLYMVLKHKKIVDHFYINPDYSTNQLIS